MGQKVCGVVSSVELLRATRVRRASGCPPSTLHPCPSPWTWPVARRCPRHPVSPPGVHFPRLPVPSLNCPLHPPQPLSSAGSVCPGLLFLVLLPALSQWLGSLPGASTPTPWAPCMHSTALLELGSHVPARGPPVGPLLAGSSTLPTGPLPGQFFSEPAWCLPVDSAPPLPAAARGRQARGKMACSPPCGPHHCVCTGLSLLPERRKWGHLPRLGVLSCFRKFHPTQYSLLP